MDVYEELLKKTQANEHITLADLRKLAMIDPIVNKTMFQHDLNKWPLEDALAACVCILSAQLNSTREALGECYARNGSGQPITVTDVDGKILAELRFKQNE